MGRLSECVDLRRIPLGWRGAAASKRVPWLSAPQPVGLVFMIHAASAQWPNKMRKDATRGGVIWLFPKSRSTLAGRPAVTQPNPPAAFFNQKMAYNHNNIKTIKRVRSIRIYCFTTAPYGSSDIFQFYHATAQWPQLHIQIWGRYSKIQNKAHPFILTNCGQSTALILTSGPLKCLNDKMIASWKDKSQSGMWAW